MLRLETSWELVRREVDDEESVYEDKSRLNECI
jgi:hypothetical protein